MVRDLTLHIGSELEDGPCQLFVADMRLHIAAADLFTYPDLFVVCGPLLRLEGRSDTLTDATLIVEVLSQSTKQNDQGQKFLFYQGLPSFREYLLVSQDKQLVELRTSRHPGEWRSVQMSEGDFELTSTGVTLNVERLYRRLEIT